MKSKISKKTINLAKSISRVISSRDVIFALREVIKDTDAQTIIIDFNNVDFISRSAAHELLLLKSAFLNARKNNKDIIIKNANRDIANILRAVAASRAVSEKAQRQVPKEVSFQTVLQQF